MHRWWIYTFNVLLLITTFFLSCYSAANGSSFVNDAKPKLKILVVFGHMGKSHFEAFKPLLEELARRGHDLTVISHFPRHESAKKKEALPNYKDISLLDSEVGVMVDFIDLRSIHHTFYRSVLDLNLMRVFGIMACRIGLNNPAVKTFLQSDEKFNVILIENFNTNCFLGFAHKFKAPYIGLTSHQSTPWVNEAINNEDNPSYISTHLLGFIKPVNFFKRMENTLVHFSFKLAYDYWFQPNDQAMAEKVYDPDLPNLQIIAKQLKALLVGTHSSIHGNRPQLSNVVEVGGLHIPPRTKPLPMDLVEFIDSAHEGLLYINFGSMIKAMTMPQKKLDIIIKVLASLPRKVLWKWENDVLPYKMNNIMINKWLPQFDILSKQMKFFID